MRTKKPKTPGKRVVYTPYITVKGRRIWAAERGLQAFRFEVDD